ncbi:bifunctional adenosylcobinamide kinase/adenosylcobinamide-phosphate guanylyltransferase [Aquihabitans daechungensis]|uniref:bifunctional adenosylcobinamide kinase/adenosylcobinamide-phosphate guanylyltransferase n=1 Tax=Aquihabitans daechungensis TaxID=1052257 RepID=UPI003BA3D583
MLGGTRSGKSRVAEALAGDLVGTVTYVATATVDPADADHTARIEAHRVRRPEAWTTVECPDPLLLPAVLADLPGPVLLDSLGTWVAGHPDLVIDAPGLAAALRARPHPTVVVSEEVGWSLHAPTEVGRRFVDAVGLLNQEVAAVADRVLLVVAGRILELPPC